MRDVNSGEKLENTHVSDRKAEQYNVTRRQYGVSEAGPSNTERFELQEREVPTFASTQENSVITEAKEYKTSPDLRLPRPGTEETSFGYALRATLHAAGLGDQTPTAIKARRDPDYKHGSMRVNTMWVNQNMRALGPATLDKYLREGNDLQLPSDTDNAVSNRLIDRIKAKMNVGNQYLYTSEIKTDYPRDGEKNSSQIRTRYNELQEALQKGPVLYELKVQQKGKGKKDVTVHSRYITIYSAKDNKIFFNDAGKVFEVPAGDFFKNKYHARAERHFLKATKNMPGWQNFQEKVLGNDRSQPE